MAYNIMIQGTMSNAGKSILAAGLCRIFHQDGYRVAPFKSQNMALNSFITEDGLEMGRAQVVQAEAAGIKPQVEMNPVLLKPTSDVGSQVIVMGKPLGNMQAKEYFRHKKELIPDILQAYHKLEQENDIIVIEGAGSPAEINLKADDIVNMGLAKLLDAPVLLVGDIDRGGVFAQLYGTVELLEPEEKKRIKGLCINKFRGDLSILEPGIEMLNELCHIPVVGTIPYIDVDIDDEDSQSTRLTVKKQGGKPLDIAVIRLPHLSNFTDFKVLEQENDLFSLRYVERAQELKHPDLLILPGTKNTMADLLYLRTEGLEAAIKKYVAADGLLFGICGGYQMLGQQIVDECQAEASGNLLGMGFLPVRTTFSREKVTRQSRGKTTTGQTDSWWHTLPVNKLSGYEIHMGRSVLTSESDCSFAYLENGEPDGCVKGNVAGTYLHGVFDEEAFQLSLLEALYRRKYGEDAGQESRWAERAKRMDYGSYKEKQYDKLADTIRRYMDMEYIYHILFREKP